MQSLRDILFLRTCGVRRVIGVPLSRDLRKPRVDPATGFTESGNPNGLVRCLAPFGADLISRSRRLGALICSPKNAAARGALAHWAPRLPLLVSIGASRGPGRTPFFGLQIKLPDAGIVEINRPQSARHRTSRSGSRSVKTGRRINARPCRRSRDSGTPIHPAERAGCRKTRMSRRLLH